MPVPMVPMTSGINCLDTFWDHAVSEGFPSIAE